MKLYEPNNLAELMMKTEMIKEKIRIMPKGGALIRNKGSNGYRPYSMTRSYSHDLGNPISTIDYGRGNGDSRNNQQH